MKFESNFFQRISWVNNLWNSIIRNIYKTALDYAIENNHPQIVELLREGPKKTIRETELMNEISELNSENSDLRKHKEFITK